ESAYLHEHLALEDVLVSECSRLPIPLESGGPATNRVAPDSGNQRRTAGGSGRADKRTHRSTSPVLANDYRRHRLCCLLHHPVSIGVEEGPSRPISRALVLGPTTGPAPVLAL